MAKEQPRGGFRGLSQSYKSNPTIENYVALRRKHPKETIEIAVSGGYEWLFDNVQTLEQFGISPELFDYILDGADHDAISALSLQLLELIIERKKSERSGQTHVVSRKLAIGDQLVNYLINMMLDALDWNDHLCIPRDLIVLIRHQTGGGTSDWGKSEKLNEQKMNALLAGLRLSVEGTTPSLRAIANHLGVTASTDMRWFPHDELNKALRPAAELAAVVRKTRKAAKTRPRSSGRARRRHSQPSLVLR